MPLPPFDSGSPGICSTWRPSANVTVSSWWRSPSGSSPTATGTVREVVVRVLRELRQEGVVHTGPHGITIVDPERLFGAAQAQRWNEGS